MPSDGKIIISFPKWIPESLNNIVSVLSSTQVQCATGLTGFSSNKINCTFTVDFSSSTAFDSLEISGPFDSSATNIVFKVSGVLNPPSTTSYTGISITTSAIDTANVLDTGTNINFPMAIPSPLDSSNVLLLIPSAFTKINIAAVYTFNITIKIPLTAGSSIKMTFPATLTPTTPIPAIQAISNIDNTMTVAYDTTNKILTLSNIVAAGNLVSENKKIQFSVTTVTNPTTTQPTNSIIYESFDSSGGAIERCNSGIIVTATPGLIASNATVVPVDPIVKITTSYAFKFQPENIIPAGSILYIVFPSTISITNLTSNACLTNVANIAVGGLCTITENRYLTIK